jgi:hypothetical protein
MAMPTNSKTWLHDVNNVVNNGDISLDARDILFNLVRQLVAFGCTVRRCSYWDGAAFQLADSDNWTVATNIVWRTNSSTDGDKSWVVIRLPSIFGPTFDILISCRRYSATFTSTMVSFTDKGFNLNGTSTTVPTVVSGTATVVSAYPVSSAAANITPGTTAKKLWNCSVSSDSKCFRFWIMSESLCCGYFEFSKMKNPASGLASTDDWVMIWNYLGAAASTNVTTYARLFTTPTNVYGDVAAFGVIGLEPSGECRLGATLPASAQYTSVPNPQDSNTYPLLPVGLWSVASNTYAYGRFGEIFDMWWASSVLANGSTFPGDGSKTHIKLGEAIVVPWEAGVIPVIA